MRHPPRMLCALLTWSALACGSEGSDAERQDGGVSEPSKPGETRGDGGSRASAFSVDVASSKAELCVGECADLSVSLRNAEGSVRYAWSDGLPASEIQHVCPTRTQTFRLEATLSKASGEFQTEEQASDGITLQVRDCSVPKADEGVLCEVRHRYDSPRLGSAVVPHKPSLNVATYWNTSAIEATPDGGAWMVGSFAQELDLGAGRVQAKATWNTFLHKLDRDCKPVRTLVLGATNPSDAVVPSALAVDPQGNAYVAAVAGAMVEPNSLVPSFALQAGELLVEKFSPTGKSLYRYRIVVGPGGLISDLEVNEAGEAFVSGMVPATTNLGSGLPIGLLPTTLHTFALKLSAAGTYATQRIDTASFQLVASGERIYHISNGTRSIDALASALFALPPEAPAYDVTSALQADLKVQYVSTYDPVQNGWAMVGARSTDGAAALFQREAHVEPTTFRRIYAIRRYRNDGAAAQDVAFIDRSYPSGGGAPDAGSIPGAFDSYSFSYMHESEPGAMVLAGNFGGTQVLGGSQLTARPSGEAGSLVLKLDQADQIRWARQQDWGPQTLLRGVSSLASGEVFVVGQARVEGSPDEAADLEWHLVIRKLRAD